MHCDMIMTKFSIWFSLVSTLALFFKVRDLSVEPLGVGGVRIYVVLLELLLYPLDFWNFKSMSRLRYTCEGELEIACEVVL